MSTPETRDKIPPHSIEAEQALLGAIFLDNAVMNEVASVVRRPEEFYRTRHQLIYAVMQKLSETGTEIDWITVKEALTRRGELEEAGGVEYLQEITEIAPTSLGARHYAEVVRDKAILRAIILSASEVREQAYDPTHTAEELIEKFEEKVFHLGAARFQSETQSVPKLLEKVREQIELFRKLRLGSGEVPGLPSGFKDLDRLLTGFKGGELLVLAARPGHGKTSIALNIAEHAALTAAERREDGRGGVLFFSLEMTGVELVSRMLCSMSGVSLREVRLGSLTPEQLHAIEEAQRGTRGRPGLAHAPLYIDDSFLLSMTEIRAKARRLAEKSGIELIVVDYLQLINGDMRLDRHEQIGIVSRGLKSLARELDVPIIALAQLNRSIEQRRGVQQRPMLSDLRESGSIEQDADVVMFIQRERLLDAAKRDEAEKSADAYAGEEREEQLDIEPASLIVAKNRAGPTGDVELVFRKSCTRFETPDKRYARELG
ncbi:MAG: replicative DNA helicase [Planctomycetaceae bacterium]|nr:replicative DNA helicase [Planctomycetaceae bacterium]